MVNSSYVFDVNGKQFSQLVIDGSAEVPVMVDFWASWCRPCQILGPIITKLAEEFSGKFLLAKVNVDENKELAMRYDARSIPTVKIFLHGEIVDGFVGVRTESSIREMLERFIERESDAILETAVLAYQQGDVTQALSLLKQAGADDPENIRVSKELVQIQLETGDYVAFIKTFNALPYKVRESDEWKALRAKTMFADIVLQAPDRDALLQRVNQDNNDLTSCYQLGALLALGEEYEAALEKLLMVLQKDRRFNDGAARKGLLLVFDMLDGRGKLVEEYRRKMSLLLY